MLQLLTLGVALACFMIRVPGSAHMESSYCGHRHYDGGIGSSISLSRLCWLQNRAPKITRLG